MQAFLVVVLMLVSASEGSLCTPKVVPTPGPSTRIRAMRTHALVANRFSVDHPYSLSLVEYASGNSKLDATGHVVTRRRLDRCL